MKSFCFKTNNTLILNYLLKRIKEINFENLIYSKNKFKIYKNIIIHYTGNDNIDFYNFLNNLIEEIVIKFYEEKILKQLINYNYFYFDEYEKLIVLKNCKEIIESKEYNKKIYENQTTYNYLLENKVMILDGFIYFRLKEYLNYLDEIVDMAVNQFILDKEYKEFINLLKIYIETSTPKYNLLHLIYVNGESILLDEKKNRVLISDNLNNTKYLSDITFSSNDLALNTLLTLLPKKIEIHLIDKEDEFINTLKLIFDGKISICKECNMCKIYKHFVSEEKDHNKSIY